MMTLHIVVQRLPLSLRTLHMHGFGYYLILLVTVYAKNQYSYI